MKNYRTFNPTEFTSYIKSITDSIKYVLTHAKAKYVIYQASADNNYNVDVVYQHIHETIIESYPMYMLKLDKVDWKKIYSKYMGDKELAPRLQKILEMNNSNESYFFYRDCFFETIRDCGINPDTMRIDMALDLFGWHRVLQILISKTEEVSFSEISRTRTETSQSDKSLIAKEKLEKSGEKVSKMLVAYYLNQNKEIDKTREIGKYMSQQEACDSLGINKGVLSNYLKGRKDSIFWKNEAGQKVRIGFDREVA